VLFKKYMGKYEALAAEKAAAATKQEG